LANRPPWFWWRWRRFHLRNRHFEHRDQALRIAAFHLLADCGRRDEPVRLTHRADDFVRLAGGLAWLDGNGLGEMTLIDGERIFIVRGLRFTTGNGRRSLRPGNRRGGCGRFDRLLNRGNVPRDYLGSGLARLLALRSSPLQRRPTERAIGFVL